MICPRCACTQPDESVQCPWCGVIIAKYACFLEEQARRAARARNQQRRRRRFAFLAVVAVPLAGWWKIPIGILPGTDSAEGVSARLAELPPPANNVERAVRATVYIKTSLGTGSGFFLNADCDVVTNRHVVGREEDDLAWLREEIRDDEIALEEELRDIERREQALARSAADGSQEDREAEERRLEWMRRKHEEGRRKLEERRAAFDGLEHAGRDESLRVILADGSTLEVLDVVLSSKSDLAILETDGFDCPYLKSRWTENLPQGTRVLTIGSPLGLRNVVTAGVFSGTVLACGGLYLQTDAPINSGNSGGPLIDVLGRVIGVNTMTRKDAQGIGFAIPIDAVRDEFELYLPDQPGWDPGRVWWRWFGGSRQEAS